jgi:microcompartment protein CcmL/EutN
MKNYQTIAVIDFSSIADGLFCTDALLKKAPIAMIKSGTVSRGRHLVIFGGTTGSVAESLTEALGIGNGSVIDHVFLPDIHEKVHDAILGKRARCADDAVAILETDTVSANVQAAELAIKGTNIQLVEIRLAEYEMSGKAISVYNGPLHDTEHAMSIAGEYLRTQKRAGRYRIIPSPHKILTQQLNQTTRYIDQKLRAMRGEEAS